MSRSNIIQTEIFVNAEIGENPRASTNKFFIPFDGGNSLSANNELMYVSIYEKTDQTISDDKMRQVEFMIRSQIQPRNFPDLLPLPKYYHNLDGLNDGTVTDSVFIWEHVPLKDLDLSPIFSVTKLIYFFKRVDVTVYDMNELHVVVDIA